MVGARHHQIQDPLRRASLAWRMRRTTICGTETTGVHCVTVVTPTPIADGERVRAIVKLNPERGCQLDMNRAEPDLGPLDVRLQVAAASVCGTDNAFFESGDAGGDLGMTYPRTMGHEVSGTVVEVGRLVGELNVGDRVAVESHLHCGQCFFCLSGNAHNCTSMGILGVTVDGAFAERVIVPARSCFPLPDDIDLQDAALLESAGSAMHAILRSGAPLGGASVLVTGAGPVGLVAAQIANALGARAVVLVEPNLHRRQLATRLNVDAVDSAGEPLESADTETRRRGGFDIALECSGAMPALVSAIQNVRRESTVMSVGLVKGMLELNVTETLITRGVSLRGSWGRSLWETWDQMASMVVEGRVDLATLVTHRLPLGRFPDALRLMQGEAGKVLLDPALPETHSTIGLRVDEVSSAVTS